MVGIARKTFVYITAALLYSLYPSYTKKLFSVNIVSIIIQL